MDGYMYNKSIYKNIDFTPSKIPFNQAQDCTASHYITEKHCFQFILKKSCLRYILHQSSTYTSRRLIIDKYHTKTQHLVTFFARYFYTQIKKYSSLLTCSTSRHLNYVKCFILACFPNV